MFIHKATVTYFSDVSQKVLSKVVAKLPIRLSLKGEITQTVIRLGI